MGASAPVSPSILPGVADNQGPHVPSSQAVENRTSGGRKRPLGLFIVLAAVLGVGALMAATFWFWPQIREKLASKSQDPPTPVPASPAVPSQTPAPDGTSTPEGPTSPKAATPSNPAPSKTAVPQPGKPSFPPNSNPTPEVRPATPAASAGSDSKPATPPASATPEEVATARKLLTDFMEAETVEDRLELVHTPEKVERQMRDYYAKQADLPRTDTIDFKLSNRLEDSDKRFYVFQVTTDQQDLPFPVAIEETESGMKVDWRSFVEFHDNMLRKFLNVYQEKPETFRVMLERAHYFKDDVPDIGNKHCFRIKPPVPGIEGYVFAEKGSVIGEKLDNEFSWASVYLPVVELAWKKEANGQTYIKITDVRQRNWRATQ